MYRNFYLLHYAMEVLIFPLTNVELCVMGGMFAFIATPSWSSTTLPMFMNVYSERGSIV